MALQYAVNRDLSLDVLANAYHNNNNGNNKFFMKFDDSNRLTYISKGTFKAKQYM